MNLNQVTIPSLDITKALGFYKKLGLQLIVKSSHYARFVCPDGQSSFSIHLVEKLPSGHGVLTYFECEHLDEEVERLKKDGVHFDEEPNDKAWLWREAHLKDLDGNRIILYFAGKNRLNPPWRLKSLSECLEEQILFKSERLTIANWSYIETNPDRYPSLEDTVRDIMSPKVTEALPEGWQHINTNEKAKRWLEDRKSESSFYAITLNDSGKIIGFLFLYSEQHSYELRLGYLLAESVWGKGIGSEFIKNLVHWAKETHIISSISGGVESENIGSIKVLEKSGFIKSKEVLPSGALFYKMNL